MHLNALTNPPAPRNIRENIGDRAGRGGLFSSGRSGRGGAGGAYYMLTSHNDAGRIYDIII